MKKALALTYGPKEVRAKGFSIFFYFPIYVSTRLSGVMVAIFRVLVYFNLLRKKRWAWILTLILNIISIIICSVNLRFF